MKNYIETIGMTVEQFKEWHGGANWKRDLKNVVIEDNVIIDTTKKKAEVKEIVDGGEYTIAELKAAWGKHLEQNAKQWYAEIINSQKSSQGGLLLLYTIIIHKDLRKKNVSLRLHKKDPDELIFEKAGVHLAALRMAHNDVLNQGWSSAHIFTNFCFDYYDYDDCVKAYKDYLRKRRDLEKAIDWLEEHGYIEGTKCYMIDEDTTATAEQVDGALAAYNSRNDEIDEDGFFNETDWRDRLNYLSTRQAAFRNKNCYKELAEFAEMTADQLRYALMNGYYYNYDITTKGESMFMKFKKTGAIVESANNNKFTISVFDDDATPEELAEQLSHLRVVHGCAGTGKTTDLVCRALQFTKSGKFIVDIAAPTHTAKEKIRRIIYNFRNGHFPSDVIKKRCKGCKPENIRVNTINTVQANCRKSGKPQVLFIDEASMVGKEILWPMIESSLASYTQVFIYGDPFQLPPVKDEDCFNDLIKMMEDYNPVGIEELTEQQRTDDYVILSYANALRAGSLDDVDKELLKIKTYQLADDYVKKNVANHTQVIGHKNSTVNTVNEFFKGIGARYITYNNDLGRYGLFNGTFGTKALDGKIIFDNNQELEFDDVKEYLKPATAVTVNRMQGHDCDSVLIAIEESNACEAFNNMIERFDEEFARRFWYTAITRAKRCVAVITNV